MSKDFDDFQKRNEAAFKVLLESGISHTNFNPPVIRVIEWLGIRTKPPHFASFISIAAMYAIDFGVIWGLIMWLLVWRTSLMSPAMALATAAGTGLAFGVAMASYYAWVRK